MVTFPALLWTFWRTGGLRRFIAELSTQLAEEVRQLLPRTSEVL